jgi:hypothetical protein
LEDAAMKTYKIEIIRRKSAFSEWYLFQTVTIRAKNIENAIKRAWKYDNPYQMHGKITEV